MGSVHQVMVVGSAGGGVSVGASLVGMEVAVTGTSAVGIEVAVGRGAAVGAGVGVGLGPPPQPTSNARLTVVTIIRIHICLFIVHLSRSDN